VTAAPPSFLRDAPEPMPPGLTLFRLFSTESIKNRQAVLVFE
jgi:hypothetical protein